MSLVVCESVRYSQGSKGCLLTLCTRAAARAAVPSRGAAEPKISAAAAALALAAEGEEKQRAAPRARPGARSRLELAAGGAAMAEGEALKSRGAELEEQVATLHAELESERTRAEAAEARAQALQVRTSSHEWPYSQSLLVLFAHHACAPLKYECADGALARRTPRMSSTRCRVHRQRSSSKGMGRQWKSARCLWLSKPSSWQTRWLASQPAGMMAAPRWMLRRRCALRRRPPRPAAAPWNPAAAT